MPTIVVALQDIITDPDHPVDLPALPTARAAAMLRDIRAPNPIYVQTAPVKLTRDSEESDT